MMISGSRERDKMPRRQSERQSDIGDVSKKIMQGLSHVHKTGGIKLDLIAIGAVLLILLLGGLVFFNSLISTLTMVIWLLVSLGLIAIGVILYAKGK